MQDDDDDEVNSEMDKESIDLEALALDDDGKYLKNVVGGQDRAPLTVTHALAAPVSISYN